MRFRTSLIVVTCLISACSVGPNYIRPSIDVPTQYKEANNKNDWKIANPQETKDRGYWWTLFNDTELNALENQLNISNQTILQAEANYKQALALVDEARASYFPSIAVTAALTRQKQAPGGGLSVSTTTSSVAAASNGQAHFSTIHNLLFNASWEPDIWGSVRRTVEASRANAQAVAALLANTRLSAQASLAQFYFELRSLDNDQKWLNNTIAANQALLKLTHNQYKSGVASLVDIVQAQSQLEAAQAAAINNGINRAQFEHAIAVLLGKPPTLFSIPVKSIKLMPPSIPTQIPSLLLERRPDIAQAERLVAQANAQIGIAIATYYPSLSLTAAGNTQGTGLSHWFSLPALSWALGSQVAETLFDGGLRSATTAVARANHQATIASYRQTVLAAFQDVEDNLSSLRILNQESLVLNNAANNARLALKLTTNQYKAGTIAYANVVTAQIVAFAAEKNANDTNGLQMTSAIGLIKALGGSWDMNSDTQTKNSKNNSVKL